MSPQEGRVRAGLTGLARRIIEYWALLGGLLLLAIVLANAYSLVANILFNAPLPGDFELVEVGVAVAAFSFLPYCQLTDANVSADIFTARAGPRTVAFLAIVAGLIAFVFGCLLVWRMGQGLIDYQRYRETTAITGFPLWIAFFPIVISLVLLVVPSLITIIVSAAQFRAR